MLLQFCHRVVLHSTFSVWIWHDFFLATIQPWSFVFLAFLLEKGNWCAVPSELSCNHTRQFLWYICWGVCMGMSVLCVYNTYLYTHVYYTISVYVCGERTCWFSPGIYSCIRILNMYIECRCPAYTCVYVTNLGWQFFPPALCKLLSLTTYFHWSCII